MTTASDVDVRALVGEVYRTESRRVYATLVRLLKDFDLAEEAMHDAFATAVESWRTEGVPNNPRAWLVSTGRFKAIDSLRRKVRLNESLPEIAERFDKVADANAARSDADIEDDRLRLIFTCCHPAIAPAVQIALTLREVCGLTTEEIASAFLTAPATMAQRIVRGKAKIRDAGISFDMPSVEDIPERLESVLTVIYLVFNEGYSASFGTEVTRADLSGEAIRLGRLLAELMPAPEVLGLLALMLLQESRRLARSTSDGDLILLEDQDRSLWDRTLIDEGSRLMERALATRRFGAYTIQAVIAALHASAAKPDETDWVQIAGMYEALSRLSPSPVVDLNRAVAIAMRDGPAAGLALIQPLLDDELAEYHLAHAAQADLCRRLGDIPNARQAYERALNLATQEPERRYLQARLAALAD